MKNKTRQAANPIIIRDRTELAESIKRIGDLQREKSSIAKELNDRIAELQNELAQRVEPLDVEIQSIAYGIKTYMDANRDQVLPPDKKSVELPTGSVAYRDKPPKVVTRITDKFLREYLTKHGLSDYYDKAVRRFAKLFLNLKLELDKQSVLKQPTLSQELGIEIESNKERFYIKPSSIDEEIELTA